MNERKVYFSIKHTYFCNEKQLIDIIISSKEMGFLNPNFPFFSEGEGAV